jgi:hypothetical protein
MLAEGDPIAMELFARYKNVPMPNLRLSESEIALGLSYLESQGRVLPEREWQDAPSFR